MAKEIIPDPQLFGWAWPVFGAAASRSTVFAAQLKQLLSALRRRFGSLGIFRHGGRGVVIPLLLRADSGES